MTLYIKDLTVRFGEKTILDDISFDIPNGSIIGLVAPNGTGKTTMFNAIMRYIPIQGGEIAIDDKVYKNTRSDILKLHQQITFFPDQADLYENFTGREHIKLYAEIWKKDASNVEDIIQLLHMGHYADNLVHTYSLGMRQRLCFAMMYAADTPVMLMDEVMNGLDPENVNLVSGVLQALRKEGKVIMVSSHLLDNLDEYADKVFFLHAGKIIFVSDHHEKKDNFVKAQLNTEDYESLVGANRLPEETFLLDNGLCCVPVKTDEEILKYLSLLRQYDPTFITVGPLGTADHYIRIYDFTTENKE